MRSQSSHTPEEKANGKPGQNPRLTRSERERERKRKALEYKAGTTTRHFGALISSRPNGKPDSSDYRLEPNGIMIASSAKQEFIDSQGRDPNDYTEWLQAIKMVSDLPHSTASVFATIVDAVVKAGQIL